MSNVQLVIPDPYYPLPMAVLGALVVAGLVILALGGRGRVFGAALAGQVGYAVCVWLVSVTAAMPGAALPSFACAVWCLATYACLRVGAWWPGFFNFGSAVVYFFAAAIEARIGYLAPINIVDEALAGFMILSILAMAGIDGRHAHRSRTRDRRARAADPVVWSGAATIPPNRLGVAVRRARDRGA